MEKKSVTVKLATSLKGKEDLIEKIGLIVLMGFLIIPYPLFMLPETGLDNSWILALALANQFQLEFGTDFIFTYGPLGYLATGFAHFQDVYSIVLFRLFIIANGLFFVYHLYKNLHSTLQKIIGLLCVVLLNFLFCQYVDILLYFYFLFHVFYYLRHKSIISMLVFSAIACVSLYVKANVGIVLSLLFAITIIYFLLDKIGNKFHALAGLGLFIGLHVLLDTTLKIDIKAYIGNALDVVNYYNDAMFIVPRPGVLTIAILIVVTLVSVMLFHLREILQKRAEIFLFFNIALFLYILFKYGFVRGDSGHYPAFFLAIPYLALLIYLFTGSLNIRSNIFKMLPLILIMISLVKVTKPHFVNDAVDIVRNAMTFKTEKKKAFDDNLSKVKLPQAMLDRVGKKSVDIMPSEVSFAFFNGLNYNPRPVMQSYSAYSSKLSQANYAKYMSASAPDYVIYHTGDLIDNHFATWDDQHLYLALLQRYRMIDTGTIDDKKLILFEKEAGTKTIQKHMILDTVMELGQHLAIPKTDKMLFMDSDLSYSIPGTIKRFLYQPSPVKLELTDGEQKKSTFKIVMPLLKSGLLINKSLHLDNEKKDVDFNAMHYFFDNDGNGGSEIIGIKFITPGLWTKKKFRVRFWTYSL
ncbi:MAG: hypothetical protein EOO04_14590 [Chitinophagaceae bacterium]|nr:MAG: hypothetical protein EOO04_14590 [Chitinophagaceae bacterium]